MYAQTLTDLDISSSIMAIPPIPSLACARPEKRVKRRKVPAPHYFNKLSATLDGIEDPSEGRWRC